MKERLLAAAGPLFGVLLFAIAISVLHAELVEHPYREVVARFSDIPPDRFALAVLATAAGYLTLTGYDALALRWIGFPLGYARTALASFIAFVFSHNVGVSFLGGSAVRYRMFTTWGVQASDLARIIPFNIATFWLGFLALTGSVSVAAPLHLPGGWDAFFPTSRPFGAVCLVVLAVYVAQTFRPDRSLTLRGFEIALPGPATTAAQIALSALDWLLAASVFFVLLPSAATPSFAQVLSAFLLAQMLGVLSNVPAGLGVFDTMMVLLLAPWLAGADVLASALAYRMIYYLLPLVVAVALFAGFEVGERRDLLRRAAGGLTQWAPELVPRILTIATFAAGVVLLLSSATPADSSRIEWIAQVIPLPVLEASHFLSSLVGVGLLLLAHAMQSRVDAAYAVTLALLATGAMLSLLKGFDWEEAALLSAVAFVLAPCRRFFYRRSSLLAPSFSSGWIASILLALVGTGFVVLLAYRHVEYAHDLWWQFELDSNAPRTLRALVGSAGLIAVIALAKLLRPTPPNPVPTGAADLARVLPIVRASTRSSASLALVGDKQLLFQETGDAFLMYGIAGRCWVAMGDPIGPPDARRELAWRFHELADAHGALTAFYEVGAENLPIYLDLGLSLRKLGEEARVRLSDFSLEGSARKGLRQNQRRVARDGACFEVIPATAVGGVIDELAAVSNAWLRKKNTREKRFSLGHFDRDYLARTPIAVVRRGERIVAFTNLWTSDARDELSLDLMRYDADAPSGVMEFLFTEVMLWGKEEGYTWFSLGMSPLSGFEHHRLAPAWSRLGALLFRHGENFYNFRGLRGFKQKFDPTWEPRYLASPGGLALPIVLSRIASLISGGLVGAVRK
ncbi:MAG: bifunctional lysylphosphatidylglycerol flippase/synthetase MprF [Myxococcota bacterium]